MQNMDYQFSHKHVNPRPTSQASSDIVSIVRQSEHISNSVADTLIALSRRTQALEDHMRKLFDGIIEWTQSKAEIRNTGDGLAKVIMQFGQLDTHPTTTSFSLSLTAQALFSQGDHRDSEITLLQERILPLMASYGSAFKIMRQDLKTAKTMEEHHLHLRRELVSFFGKLKKIHSESDKANSEPAEILKTKLIKSMADSAYQTGNCVKLFAKLELRKCQDLKRIMVKWFKIQLKPLAKNLEICTQGFQMARQIDALGDTRNLLKQLELNESLDNEVEDEDGVEGYIMASVQKSKSGQGEKELKLQYQQHVHRTCKISKITGAGDCRSLEHNGFMNPSEKGGSQLQRHNKNRRKGRAGKIDEGEWPSDNDVD